MKKYLLFAPLALVSYIWILHLMIFSALSGLVSGPVNSQISQVIMTVWELVSLVTYIVGLYKLLKDDRYDENFAAKVSAFVKFPQIVPGIVMGLCALGLVIVPPIGIMISFVLWAYMIVIYFTTSIVVAAACIKIKKLGKLSTAGALALGFLSFLPVMEYIVPIILLARVGIKKVASNFSA